MPLAISDEVAVEFFDFGHQIGREEIDGNAGAAQTQHSPPRYALVWIKRSNDDAPNTALDESLCARNFRVVPGGAGFEGRVDRASSDSLRSQLLFQSGEFGMISFVSVPATRGCKNFAVAYNYRSNVRVRLVVFATGTPRFTNGEPHMFEFAFRRHLKTLIGEVVVPGTSSTHCATPKSTCRCQVDGIIPARLGLQHGRKRNPFLAGLGVRRYTSREWHDFT
jgi:hypothetical protein